MCFGRGRVLLADQSDGVAAVRAVHRGAEAVRAVHQDHGELGGGQGCADSDCV